jgi:hypothetical protein
MSFANNPNDPQDITLSIDGSQKSLGCFIIVISSIITILATYLLIKLLSG